MAGTLEFPKTRNPLARETQRTWLTAALALAASLAMMLVASPATVSPVAHWVVSSIALTTALVVFVAGLRAWDELVSSAQAAGVVER
ncbi:hypothetical protein [Mycolicibacterium iranicum]|uniref:Uncharacterized protein n=1 Tax=Mycolicibacterium iranicum TaxID=912594 RepID=A0A178LXM3_MYCIR|nr:hypothetical protein [Mycolicibacterium iranicum]OAN39435.1 hypothetical protein A4X20_17280 [Mycolicibacterium iranicum]